MEFPRSQADEVKYLGILFMSEGQKREMSHEVKLSIYCRGSVPILTYDYELWAMTERIRLQIQQLKGFPLGRLGSDLEID